MYIGLEGFVDCSAKVELPFPEMIDKVIIAATAASVIVVSFVMMTSEPHTVFKSLVTTSSPCCESLRGGR